jgi:hypothetical protein
MSIDEIDLKELEDECDERLLGLRSCLGCLLEIAIAMALTTLVIATMMSAGCTSSDKIKASVSSAVKKVTN